MESRRKTVGASLQIPFDSVKNGGVFHGVEASLPGLVFEVRISSFEAGEPVFDNANGSGVQFLCAVDVANDCHRFCLATPFIEDDGSKVLMVLTLSLKLTRATFYNYYGDVQRVTYNYHKVDDVVPVDSRKFWNIRKNQLRFFLPTYNMRQLSSHSLIY
ncbi:hypothetical protein Y032_0008g203 [Ancylostoma ceylanicum]|uniref:Uncharacterized protein n=1 Tax=Ancylostoma ceylanicum TaxID=53326 RepID=A0A016VLB2_9BILA|nr:hypothetical protein Y032_0008g203 [Ancylostoma ceylanicum]